jgi:hypothetical protein
MKARAALDVESVSSSVLLGLYVTLLRHDTINETPRIEALLNAITTEITFEAFDVRISCLESYNMI